MNTIPNLFDAINPARFLERLSEANRGTANYRWHKCDLCGMHYRDVEMIYDQGHSLKLCKRCKQSYDAMIREEKNGTKKEN